VEEVHKLYIGFVFSLKMEELLVKDLPFKLNNAMYNLVLMFNKLMEVKNNNLQE